MADGQAKKQIIYDPEEFAIRKRLPPSLPRRNIDVYITNKTAFKAQLERCHNFIEKSEPEFYIHSLGSGIPRALNLALKVQKDHSQTVSIESVTSTVELTDDFEPFRRDLPEQQRNVSKFKVLLSIFNYDFVEYLKILGYFDLVFVQYLNF